jgi:hypothetical protein
MDWIDFSGLKTDKQSLPPDIRFETADDFLDGERIAPKGDMLLLSMRSDKLPAGAIRFVRDHINLSGKNPLRGHNQDEYGVRFPDMSQPYVLPDNCPESQTLVIRAGQHPEYSADLPEAAPVVYQTIIAKHQQKRVTAILYGSDVTAAQIIQTIKGDKHA